MGIVVIGAIFLDVKGYPLDKYIPAGRNSGRVEYVHGGVARNVAEDIANMELRPTFVSLIDDSANGQAVLEKLKKHKVNTDFIAETKDGMGTWLAVFDNEGDVVASISKRPDMTRLHEIIDAHAEEIFAGADSIAVEIDFDKDVVKQIFDYAGLYGKDVYALVSNMSIAVQRRDLIRRTRCFICNQQEAGILFSEDYSEKSPEEMQEILYQKIQKAGIESMVVTMGGKGAVYASSKGEHGYAPAQKVEVKDTTGAGDSFFAGVCAGLTYGKTMAESCEIASRIAASVIATSDNVCPRFQPAEFGFENI